MKRKRGYEENLSNRSTNVVDVHLFSKAELKELDNDGEFDLEAPDDLENWIGYSDLGRCYEYHGTHQIEGKITVGGEHAGVVKMYLVDRAMAGSIFYPACDAVSQEMQEMSVSFFDRYGSPRNRDIKGVDSGLGGVLYIDHFELKPEFRVNQNGAQALRKLLTATALAGRWEIAIYIPFAGCQSPLDNYRSASKEQIFVWQDLDYRQCFQCGFKQSLSLGSRGKNWVFASPEMVSAEIITKEAADSIRIIRAEERPEKAFNALEQGLRNYVLNLDRTKLDGAGLISTVKVIKAFVECGVDLKRADILHCASHNNLDPLFAIILQLGGQDCLESRDGSGLTPLMVRAALIVGTSGSTMYTKLDTTGIEMLLSLGADKTATDPKGCTPYGICLERKRNSDDFHACFGMDTKYGPMKGYDELIALLRPGNGMTAADLEANYGVDPIQE